jgi:branched-chain amino acid transport system substrate-binding protein
MASLAQAQQEVRVGVILPYTGVGAELAQQIDRGMEQYLKLNPAQAKGYKFTLVKRDVKDPSGANARTLVQELLTQDKVDVLAGWVYSPNAIASAPVLNAGRKLAVIMNAGTAHITQMSNYYVRTSFSMWHAGYAMGETAAKRLKAKTAVVGYTDFPPGKDMLASFKRAFEASGGKVIDELPMGGAEHGDSGSGGGGHRAWFRPASGFPQANIRARRVHRFVAFVSPAKTTHTGSQKMSAEVRDCMTNRHCARDSCLQSLVGC